MTPEEQQAAIDSLTPGEMRIMLAWISGRDPDAFASALALVRNPGGGEALS
jgi:hypothetical protein